MHVNRMTVTVRGSLSLSASGVHVQAARDRAGTRVPFPVSDENAAGEGSPVDAGLHWRLARRHTLVQSFWSWALEFRNPSLAAALSPMECKNVHYRGRWLADWRSETAAKDLGPMRNAFRPGSLHACPAVLTSGRGKDGGLQRRGGNQGECQQPRHYSSRFPRPTLPLEPRSLPCSHFIIKIPFSSWISLSNKTPTNVGVTEPHEQADSASPQSSEAGSPRGQRRAWPGTGAPPGRPGAGSGRC